MSSPRPDSDKGVTKARARQSSVSRSRRARVAVATMVGPAAGPHRQSAGPGRLDRDSEERPLTHDCTQASAGSTIYSEATFLLVRDAPHRPGMVFSIEVCRRAKMKEHVLHFCFSRRGEGARKAHLHGWRLWHTYCIENDYTVETTIDLKCDSTMMAYELMIVMDRQGVKDYRIREARLAVFELFEFVQSEKFPRMVASLTHGILKQASTSLSAKVNRAPRFHDIWPLGLPLRFMQNDTPAEQLGGSELMVRTAALFIKFIPCRPPAMTRMDCARARWAHPLRRRWTRGVDIQSLC
jgi:hypothetical protein